MRFREVESLERSAVLGIWEGALDAIAVIGRSLKGLMPSNFTISPLSNLNEQSKIPFETFVIESFFSSIIFLADGS